MPDRPAFRYTGVDLFGPFAVRQGRSCVKRYGRIFTCITSRAVRLEVPRMLTVDSFLNAFRRILSRRGKVHTLLSANRMNFVGAEKELRCTLCE